MAGHINARIFVHQHGRCLNQTRLQVKENDDADFFANQTGVRKMARRENPETRIAEGGSPVMDSVFGIRASFGLRVLDFEFNFALPVFDSSTVNSRRARFHCHRRDGVFAGFNPNRLSGRPRQGD
jgi:hypothetical protein